MKMVIAAFLMAGLAVAGLAAAPPAGEDAIAVNRLKTSDKHQS